MTNYTDLNPYFNENNYGGNIIITDITSVITGLTRFLTTAKGEVPFNRKYGSILKSLLFENNLSEMEIQMLLYMDITTFEPRISLSPGNIHVEKTDLHEYTISCNFSVPALNNAVGNLQTSISEN